jgi:outer membrane receptor protein involved in Fe transport
MQEQIIHGKGFYDLGIQPDIKFNIFTLWSHPSGIQAGFNFRFIDSFQECDSNNCNDPTNGRRPVDKYATGDIFVNYALKSNQGTTRIAVGMNNVIDAKPPIIYNGAALNADESAYDFMGRQVYVRLSQLF